VPALLEWPERIAAGQVTHIPCSTSDYFPTVMDVLGFKVKGRPKPVDGISLLPLIESKMTERPVPIAFESKKQLSLTDNRYKIYSNDNGKTYMLFDLLEDPGENNNLAAEKSEILRAMKKKLESWRASCKNNLAGKDY
jgi:arylsulfatase A-like enzyme